MKFNIYDKSTWTIDFTDLEKKNNDRAVGNIGQLIPVVQQIRDWLQNPKYNLPVEFTIAGSLKIQNPKAFEQMQVSIYYGDSDFGDALKECNHILSIWNEAGSQENKRTIWKDLIPSFEKIKPFIKELEQNRSLENLYKSYFFSEHPPKVDGNAAWQLYLATELNRSHYEKWYGEERKKLNEVQRELDELKSYDLDEKDLQPDSY